MFLSPSKQLRSPARARAHVSMSPRSEMSFGTAHYTSDEEDDSSLPARPAVVTRRPMSLGKRKQRRYENDMMMCLGSDFYCSPTLMAIDRLHLLAPPPHVHIPDAFESLVASEFADVFAEGGACAPARVQSRARRRIEEEMFLRVERGVRTHLKTCRRNNPSSLPLVKELESFLLAAVALADDGFVPVPDSLAHVVGDVVVLDGAVSLHCTNGSLRLVAIGLAQFHGVHTVFESLQHAQGKKNLLATG